MAKKRAFVSLSGNLVDNNKKQEPKKNYQGFNLNKLMDKNSIFKGWHNLSTVVYYLTQISNSITSIPNKDSTLFEKTFFLYDTAVNLCDKFLIERLNEKIIKENDFKELDFGCPSEEIFSILSSTILEEPSEYMSIPWTSYSGDHIDFIRYDISNGHLYVVRDGDDLKILASKNISEQDIINLIWTYFNNSIELEINSSSSFMLEEVDQSKNELFGSSIDLVKNIVEEHKFYKDKKISRNYLFIGIPGTGKTVIVNKIISQFSGRSIFISGPGIDKNIHSIKGLFSALQPDFIIFDDCDRCVFSNAIVRQFLSVISSLKEKKPEISFIYCANTFSGLLEDEAFTRKGRIDKIIEIEKPNFSDQKIIFDNYLNKLGIKLSQDEYEICIDEMGEMTGAEIYDLCIQTLRLKPSEIFKNEDVIKNIREKYSGMEIMYEDDEEDTF